jgi:hypothetical protein
MLIPGVWHQCDDGMVRPVIQGELLALNGLWVKALFLLDTGADRTVLSADVLAALQLQPVGSPVRLGGVGGMTDSVVVETHIRLTHDQPGKVSFRGQFAAFDKVEALDMSVLGRDILNLFAVIIDKPGESLCLLGQQHYYTIANRRP